MKTRNALRPIGKFLLPVLVSLILLVLLWQGFLQLYPQVGPVGKTPGEVWKYLMIGSTAESAQQLIFGQLRITLRDAMIGFAAGLGAALLVAAAFVGVPAIAQAFMPVAMLLRSVPLVALTPIIVLIFGRGLLGVTVMAAIVVFFPALVMIMTGLRSAPAQAMELVAAYGGSRWQAMRLVAIPAALPAVFAAARISVPGALIGALLGEWLGSGTGLGAGLIQAIPRFEYEQLWASIAIVTLVSVLAYAIVGVLEGLVLARFSPQAERE
ncbi:ABC transporter permease subunit [Nocardia huaxiensis]|uniref:ABC transporter permease subunit n=1 Tax=Nocardia huaxiensis TaxID=2755382 RepID=A0A7D6ZF96_9NOCA|nr:ABC transporter permease subunit [Nocardia huaxiensis]QLY32198.1 ABC transporter permease subunit [Nocardia huaxiensis]